MIEELITLAKDIQAARSRGEEHGLSPDEIAFCDALAQNDSAIEVLGNEKLRLIAHELLEQLKQNATVDWHKRESARARMRVLVKRILKKYGYPPDLADDAVKLVLEQAEALLRHIGSFAPAHHGKPVRPLPSLPPSFALRKGSPGKSELSLHSSPFRNPIRKK
jgi:type I restriction enzyme, R subunit